MNIYHLFPHISGKILECFSPSKVEGRLTCGSVNLLLTVAIIVEESFVH